MQTLVAAGRPGPPVDDRNPALPYKDPKQWELWYIPNYGQCRIYIINRL